MGTLFETGVRPAIDAWLLEESKKVRNYGNYWSASSAGYCMRRNIFERLKVPHSTPDDPRKQRVFSSGHIFHDWIQELTRNAGISIAQEIELQDEGLMVRGHFDDLVLVNGKLILIDYKTVNSRAFLWAKKNNNAMSYYHKMQLGTYLYMLRGWDIPVGDFNALETVNTSNLTEARILKIEKDTLMMMEQQLLWSPELESEVLTYWNNLNTHWQNKTLPACSCEAHEGGFMAKEKFNPYWYEGEPCSLAYYNKWKKES